MNKLINHYFITLIILALKIAKLNKEMLLLQLKKILFDKDFAKFERL